MTLSPPDQYDRWRRALGDQSIGHECACAGRLELRLDDVWSGFFRVRRGNKREGNISYVPVAIWRDGDGILHCFEGVEKVSADRALHIWPWCAQPIAENVYRSVIEFDDATATMRATGNPWPDEHPALAGDNRAPPDDSPEAIRDRIEDLRRDAKKLIDGGAAESQDAANRASHLAAKLGGLETKCTELHRVEKAPHLDAGRAVDRKWFTLRDAAAVIKARLKRVVVTPFLVKASEAKRAAAMAAVAVGAAPADIGQVKATAGSFGRSIGLRDQKTARVIDRSALHAHLAEHPDVLECEQRIANAAAKSDIALPGTVIEIEKVAA